MSNSASTSRLGLKRFHRDGANSYVVFDRETKEALLIDPLFVQIDDYRNFIGSHGLKLTWVLETHTHTDHYSGSHLLRSAFGAQIAVGEGNPGQRADEKFANGHELTLGSLRLRVLATPGHTSDSVTYLISDGKASLVFCGDTLLLGSVGRLDGETSSADARRKSLELLSRLPEDAIVLPSHDLRSLLFSTIANERAKNPFWSQPDDDDSLSEDEEARKRVQFNHASDPAAPGETFGSPKDRSGSQTEPFGAIAEISIDKYQGKLNDASEQNLFLDVRDASEVAQGAIPGTRNIPLSEVGLYLDELSRFDKIYVSCQTGRRSAAVVQTLDYLGFRGAVNLAGGFRAWEQAGMEIAQDDIT